MVYVLLSKKDNKFYVGFTKDLKQRVDQHNKGHVKSTQNRQPLRLIYYETCINKEDALRREKYLKTTYGKRYLRSRLKNYFTG